MELPIFEKLIAGVRFDLQTLLDSYEHTQRFWNHWWEQANVDQISRPETIEDSSEILLPTSEKQTVDLATNDEFFDEFLYQSLRTGRLQPGADRKGFRDQVIRIIGCNSTELTDRPKVVFSGGGYGSGKTTILNWLARNGKIPLNSGHMVGVDYFKFYVPEFSLIQSAADGRASLTVQKECVQMSDRLFDLLVQKRRSFIWDSSMSNEADTMKRVQACQHGGYEISMVGVLTPLPVAIRQSMLRAKDSRRFPHPEFLPKSHLGFRQAFWKYMDVFDDVLVFANLGMNPDNHPIIAEKSSGNRLAINDETVLNELLAVTDNKGEG